MRKAIRVFFQNIFLFSFFFDIYAVSSLHSPFRIFSSFDCLFLCCHCCVRILRILSFFFKERMRNELRRRKTKHAIYFSQKIGFEMQYPRITIFNEQPASTCEMWEHTILSFSCSFSEKYPKKSEPSFNERWRKLELFGWNRLRFERLDEQTTKRKRTKNENVKGEKRVISLFLMSSVFGLQSRMTFPMCYLILVHIVERLEFQQNS